MQATKQITNITLKKNKVNAIVIVLCGTKSCSVDTKQIPLTSMDVWPDYELSESACISQAAKEVEHQRKKANMNYSQVHPQA